MSLIILCPPPAALAPPPAQDCPFRLDQIVRFAIGRRAVPAFATEAAIKALATWTPLLEAADSTKIIMTPIFASLVIPSSEGIYTGGGDNSTFNGIPIYQGEGTVRITGQFTGLSPAVVDILETYSQESLASGVGLSNLGLIPINKDGFIFPKNLGLAPIYNWRLASRGSEGLNANDIIPFSFDVLADWFKGFTSVKPSFDPLVDLQNAEA